MWAPLGARACATVPPPAPLPMMTMSKHGAVLPLSALEEAVENSL